MTAHVRTKSAFPAMTIARAVAVAALAATTIVPAFAAAPAQSDSKSDTAGKRTRVVTPVLEPDQLIDAVVKVKTVAVPEARSASTLGTEREGSGVVIGNGGLILTIGYLIVEADDVEVVDHRGRTLPARVVGYDHATGFGLVRTLVPLEVPPVPLGDSSRVDEQETVMILNHHGADDVTVAHVVSKRPFTASWEYRLDEAMFTAPPTLEWSGAALIGRDGKLIGIGSLFVRETNSGDNGSPGNMFVPIDALKPILADLTRSGHRAGPARPWLGVATEESNGRLVVARVSPEGPSDRAGLRAGDIILGVAGQAVRTQSEFYDRVWSRGAAGTDIRMRVLQGIDVRELSVHSIDRTDYFKPRTTY